MTDIVKRQEEQIVVMDHDAMEDYLNSIIDYFGVPQNRIAEDLLDMDPQTFSKWKKANGLDLHSKDSTIWKEKQEEYWKWAGRKPEGPTQQVFTVLPPSQRPIMPTRQQKAMDAVVREDTVLHEPADPEKLLADRKRAEEKEKERTRREEEQLKRMEEMAVMEIGSGQEDNNDYAQQQAALEREERTGEPVLRLTLRAIGTYRELAKLIEAATTTMPTGTQFSLLYD